MADNNSSEKAGKTMAVESLESDENLMEFLLFTCIFPPHGCHD